MKRMQQRCNSPQRQPSTISSSCGPSLLRWTVQQGQQNGELYLSYQKKQPSLLLRITDSWNPAPWQHPTPRNHRWRGSEVRPDRRLHRHAPAPQEQSPLFGQLQPTRTEQAVQEDQGVPRGVSSFYQQGQLAITAADPVAARNGAAAAATVYPAWMHVEVGADGLHMDSCINLDCVTSFTNEVLGAQQQQQQQRFQPQYMSRNNAPPPQQHQQQYQPTRSRQYQTYHPQQPSQQQQQPQQQQHTQPHHIQQNSKQQQQQAKTHHPQQPPQQQVQAYSLPPPPAYPSQPTRPRYNEVTMTNVAAPVRTRGSSPSGDTPGAKQRNITSKEGVNGAKH